MKLPAGQWDLTVLSKDFAPVTRWGAVLEPGVPFGPVQVSLKRGASVLVHALNSVDGLGVARARVCLVAEDGFEDVFTAMARGRAPAGARCGTTNRDGWLRLAGLPEGTFYLVSSAPKHSAGCRKIILSSQAETVIDDLEIQHPATVFLSIAGQSALPSTLKLKVDATPEVCGHLLVGLTRYLAVPPDGEVSIDGVPPGRLHLEATVITPNGLAATADRQTLNLMAGDIRSVPLDLSGTLYHGSVTFRDEPVHANLELRRLGKAAEARSVAESDEGGDFAVFLHQPGNYDVRVLSERPALDTVVPRVAFTDPTTPVEITVPDTAIQGSVVDEQGQPVGRAQVEATLLTKGSGDSGAPSALRALPARTESAGDGTFALEGLAAGRWRLTATAGDLSSDPRQLTVSDGQAVENVILTLKKTLTVEGSVHTDRGAPVSGSHVIIVPGHGSVEGTAATTDAGGRFTLSLAARSGWQANVEVVGGTGVSWCARRPLTEKMDMVLPALGGTVVFSSGPEGLLETPNRLALLRTDGSSLGVLELLAFARASVANTGKTRALTVPALAPGTWKVVAVSSPAGIAQIINGYGLQLVAIASFTVVPGSRVEVPLSKVETTH